MAIAAGRRQRASGSGWKVVREAVSRRLVEPDRPFEVLQPLLAEVAQRDREGFLLVL